MKKITFFLIFFSGLFFVACVNAQNVYFDQTNWESESDTGGTISYNTTWFIGNNLDRSWADWLLNITDSDIDTFDYYFQFQSREMQGATTTNMGQHICVSSVGGTAADQAAASDTLAVMIRSNSNVNNYLIKIRQRDNGALTESGTFQLNVNQKYWARFQWQGSGAIVKLEVWNDAYNGTLVNQVNFTSGTLTGMDRLHVYSGVEAGVSRKYDFDVFKWVRLFVPPTTTPVNFTGAGFNASSPYVNLRYDHDLVNVDNFEIQRSLDGVSWSFLAYTPNLVYNDTGLTNGTLYYYRIRSTYFVAPNWFNSSFSLVNIERVWYVIETAAVSARNTGFIWIFPLIACSVAALVLVKDRLKR